MNDLVDLMTGVIFAPGEAFRDLSERKSAFVASIVYIVSGLPAILISQALYPESQASLTAPVFVQSMLLAVALLFVLAGLIHLSAKILGGEGEYMQMVQGFGFAGLPRILLAVFIPFAYSMGPRIEGVLGYANTVMFIWTLVLGVIAIRETHEFTTGRAIGTLFVMLGLLLVLGTAIVFVIGTFFQGVLPELPQL